MDLVGETFLMSKFLIVILAILVLAIVMYSPNIYKLYKLATLYNEKSIAKNFISINKVFDTSNPISASEKTFVFEKEDFELPNSYEFEGEQLIGLIVRKFTWLSSEIINFSLSGWPNNI